MVLVWLGIALALTFLCFAGGYWTCHQGAEAFLQFVSAAHDGELARIRDEAFQQGRFEGWHEAHSCDTACLTRILGPVAKTTSNTPEMN